MPRQQREEDKNLCAYRVGKCFDVVHSKTSTNEQHSHESSSSTPSGMPIIRSTEFVHQIIHCTTGRQIKEEKTEYLLITHTIQG
jgi:hypothetical protein